MKTAPEIALLLEMAPLLAGTEERLQNGIENVLRGAGVEFEREARLSAKDRVDFLIQHDIACEVKISGPLNEVTRQLARYAEHEEVTSLLLVTSRMQLTCVPRELNGKPVHVAVLMRGL